MTFGLMDFGILENNKVKICHIGNIDNKFGIATNNYIEVYFLDY